MIQTNWPYVGHSSKGRIWPLMHLPGIITLSSMLPWKSQLDASHGGSTANPLWLRQFSERQLVLHFLLAGCPAFIHTALTRRRRTSPGHKAVESKSDESKAWEALAGDSSGYKLTFETGSDCTLHRKMSHTCLLWLYLLNSADALLLPHSPPHYTACMLTVAGH